MFASLAGADDPPPPAPSTVVALTTLADVGEGRRQIVNLASRVGFTEARRHDLGIVATELATNVVRHGRAGHLIARPLFDHGSDSGIEVIVVDKGPGIVSIAESFRDGHSTAGSMGTGLGAALRIADTLDLFSLPGLGTAAVARLWRSRTTLASGVRALASAATGTLAATAGVSVPMPGEQACGDTWRVVSANGRTVILVVDGLGHGPAAADAATIAADLFERNAGRTPVGIVEALHAGLRSTRGAAVAVAEVRVDTREVRYVGVGNIAAVIATANGTRNLVSHNGTAGHQARRIQEFVYPWPAGATLILHTDGLTSQWRVDAYPTLRQRDPALVASILWRDFTRGRDDACVVAHTDHAGSA